MKKLITLQYTNEEFVPLTLTLALNSIETISTSNIGADEGYAGSITVRANEKELEDILDYHNRIFRATLPEKNDALRPAHYNQDNPYEVIKVIRAWGMNFELGNVLKYVARAGKKDPNKEIEDLEKAKTYLQMHIDNLKSKKNGE